MYGAATNMGRFIDTDPTPDAYMYHRQLIRLTGAARPQAEDMTIRVATAATAGGAAASTETYKVTEWLGKDLPPHVAGFKNQPFFTHYMDPTENRNNLDALATSYPELVSSVNMPEKTSGYQRKSQAIMSGSDAIGAAPDVQLGTPVFDATGEITAAPGRQLSRSRRRGTVPPRDHGRHPVRHDRLHPDAQGPHRHRPEDGRHGDEPRGHQPDVHLAGTYTIEISGFQGDLGDFTLKVQPTSGSAAASRPPRSC